MKQFVKHVLTGGLVLTLVMTPGAVFAHDGDDSDATTTNSEESSTSSEGIAQKRQEAVRKLQARLDQAKEKRTEKLDEAKSNLRERLSNAKKKICERHQSRINQIMNKMDDRRTKANERITQIYEAVTSFYSEKGLTVENYLDLIAAIDAAKNAAQSATKEQQDVPQLNCEGDGPEADVAEFKQERLDSIDAMKAYRASVKDLAKAVRTAAKATGTEGDA